MTYDVSSWDSAARLSLTHLAEVIADCWAEAEEQTREYVQRTSCRPDEEHITFLLRSELAFSVRQKSERSFFEEAFKRDLDDAAPGLRERLSWELPHELVGCVSFHGKPHEGKTGSDLALVIRQPRFEATSIGFRVGGTDARALLAQAKLGKPTRSKRQSEVWGTFNKNQRERLPSHVAHLALFLYRWQDAAGTELAPFRWQLCRGHAFEAAIEWLKTGAFPAELRAAEVIRDLAAGTVGTGDPYVCEELASPASGCQVIEIRIHWPDTKFPPEGFVCELEAEPPQRVALLEPGG